MPAFLAEIAAAIPPEVAELRPEDLRVEAEVFESVTREPVPPASEAPIPLPISPALTTPPPIEVPPPFPVREAKPELGPSELSGLFAPAPQRAEVSPAAIESAPAAGEPRAFVPPIEIEPPSVRPAGTETRRSHEVILPASVVLVCEIFVLVGLAFSFLAGLLIGHFIWIAH